MTAAPLSPEPAATAVLSDRRTLVPWFAAHAVASFAAALGGSTVYFYAKYQLHTKLVDMLWMAACGGFIYIFSSIFGGRLADRVGQKRVFIIAGCLAVPMFLIGYAAVARGSVMLLFLEVAMSNLIVSPMWPSVESALTRSRGRMKLTSRITCYNLVWSCTCFLATFLTGSIAHVVSWGGVFLFCAMVQVVALVIIVFIAVPQSMIGTHHVEDNPEDQAKSNAIRASGKSKTLLWMAWLSNSLAFVSANTLGPVMPALTLQAGITSAAVATAVGSVASLTRLIGFFFASVWTGWHYRVHWMLIFFCAMIVATAGVLMARNIVVLVDTQIFLGLTWAMLYSGSLYYSMHLSHGSGENAGIHEAVIGVGTVIGPTLAALVGGPNSLPPKTAVLLSILVAGGCGLFGMAPRARGIAKIADSPADESGRSLP